MVAKADVSGAIELSTKLRARAAARVVNAKIRQTLEIMRANHHIVPELHDHAVQLATDRPAAVEATQVPDEDAEETSDKIPEKYHSWIYASATVLRRVLSTLDPISCDLHRLRQLGRKGDREGNKYTLLKMFEQATGKHPNCTIVEYNWGPQIEHLLACYEARGRPLSRIVLPKYDPGVDGLYEVKKIEARLVLVRRNPIDGMANEVTLDRDVVGRVSAVKAFTIADNYSDTRAVLKWMGCRKGGQTVAELLPPPSTPAAAWEETGEDATTGRKRKRRRMMKKANYDDWAPMESEANVVVDEEETWEAPVTKFGGRRCGKKPTHDEHPAASKNVSDKSTEGTKKNMKKKDGKGRAGDLRSNKGEMKSMPASDDAMVMISTPPSRASSSHSPRKFSTKAPAKKMALPSEEGFKPPRAG